LTAAAILDALSPKYVEATQQVATDDPRLRTEYVEYPSPQGAGTMRGLMARPADATGDLPGIVVIHENRGLNPYVEDVVRRMAAAGFLALGPDALTSLGGYPGNDEEGRTMQSRLDGAKIREDFVAGAQWLISHPESTGKVGAVGFCFGGGMVWQLLGSGEPQLAAAVPFYGPLRDNPDFAGSKAAVLAIYGALDTRVTSSKDAAVAALNRAGLVNEVYVAPDADHAFFNDTGQRYNPAAAAEAWRKVLDWLGRYVG
jgi:carboxymethylenebutenolidase